MNDLVESVIQSRQDLKSTKPKIASAVEPRSKNRGKKDKARKSKSAESTTGFVRLKSDAFTWLSRWRCNIIFYCRLDASASLLLKGRRHYFTRRPKTQNVKRTEMIWPDALKDTSLLLSSVRPKEIKYFFICAPCTLLSSFDTLFLNHKISATREKFNAKHFWFKTRMSVSCTVINRPLWGGLSIDCKGVKAWKFSSIRYSLVHLSLYAKCQINPEVIPPSNFESKDSSNHQCRRDRWGIWNKLCVNGTFQWSLNVSFLRDIKIFLDMFKIINWIKSFQDNNTSGMYKFLLHV